MHQEDVNSDNEYVNSDDAESAIYFEEQRNLDFEQADRPVRMTYSELLERASQDAHIDSTRTSKLDKERIQNILTTQSDVLDNEPFQKIKDFDKPGDEEQAMVDHRVRNSHKFKEHQSRKRQKNDDVEDQYHSAKQKSERRKSKRQSKKVRSENEVVFKYNIKLYKLQQEKSFSFSDFLPFKSKKYSIQDLARIEHVPQIDGVPKNEYHTTVQAGQTAYI